MRQLVYSIFITYDTASFHLQWKENLLKYQKISKYYDHDCSQNFTNWLVKKSPAMGCLLCEVLPKSALQSETSLTCPGMAGCDTPYDMYYVFHVCPSLSVLLVLLFSNMLTMNVLYIWWNWLSHINLIFKQFGFFMATKLLFGKATFCDYRGSGAW